MTSDCTDPNELVRAFAANPAFRAATADELVNEDNPFRRPVRPADLAWLDFGSPLPTDRLLSLSWLLGNRMLRNVYDADLLFMVGGADRNAFRDRGHFYSAENRTRGAAAAPVLERHLFDFLPAEREPIPAARLDVLQRHVHDCLASLVKEPGKTFDAVRDAFDCRSAATFVLLQLTAIVPSTAHVLTRATLGGHPLRKLLQDQSRWWTERLPAFDTLIVDAGLSSSPVAYWQFFLGSSLARANHLHRLWRNHELLPEALGALVYAVVDNMATSRHFAKVVEEGLELSPAFFDRALTLDDLDLGLVVEQMIGMLLAGGETSVLESFYAGFEDARWLARHWDRDLAAQLAWADSIPEYVDMAKRIDAKLSEDNIEVDLDTFVESEEETSTTHVHDEHRLVVIESGQMHFWNNANRRIALTAGDKILIPKSRLHGSVVLSGTCVYHQPIIPDEMVRAV